jgi:hypothetical protein
VRVERRPDEVWNIFGTGYFAGVRVDWRFCDVPCRWNVDTSASTFRVYFSADSFAARLEATLKGPQKSAAVPRNL